mgnify:CR=1 FL=1
MAVKVALIPREGEAVQWNGWNENEIIDLFKRYAPERLLTVVPVTDETGVRTLSLYLLYDNGEDRIYDRGYWFVGHQDGIMGTHLTAVSDEDFSAYYRMLV